MSRNTDGRRKVEMVLRVSRKCIHSRTLTPHTLSTYSLTSSHKHTRNLSEICVLTQQTHVQTITPLIPIFYTFMLIVHCTTQVFSRLIMDHPLFQGKSLHL